MISCRVGYVLLAGHRPAQPPSFIPSLLYIPASAKRLAKWSPSHGRPGTHACLRLVSRGTKSSSASHFLKSYEAQPGEGCPEDGSALGSCATFTALRPAVCPLTLIAHHIQPLVWISTAESISPSGSHSAQYPTHALPWQLQLNPTQHEQLGPRPGYI